jgi:hypothetical protein
MDRDVPADPRRGSSIVSEWGEERHVVGHDLHDGVRAGDSVLVQVGENTATFGLPGGR